MPRLMVFGDIHGEIDNMYKMVDQYERDHGLHIDGVVQVGDFGVYPAGTDWAYYWRGEKKAPKPTLCIMGNHEDPDEINKWIAYNDFVPNIQLLLDGRIVDFLGVRIGGVWGNYSPLSYKDPDRVFENRSNCLRPRIAMHINRFAVEQLLEEEGPVDMLITHDAARITFPDFFKKNPMDPVIAEILGLRGKEEIAQAKGCPGFDQLLKKFKPRYYFFGHLHYSEMMEVGATRVQCLQAIQYNRNNNCYTVVEF